MALKQLRNKIEKIDTAIIKKLAQREQVTLKIGKLKKISGKTIKDAEREKKLMALYESLSEEYHLNKPFVRRLFKIIIAHSRTVQQKNRASTKKRVFD